MDGLVVEEFLMMSKRGRRDGEQKNFCSHITTSDGECVFLATVCGSFLGETRVFVDTLVRRGAPCAGKGIEY